MRHPRQARTLVLGQHALAVERNRVGDVLLLGDPRGDVGLRLEHRGAELLIHPRDHVRLRAVRRDALSRSRAGGWAGGEGRSPWVRLE